MLDEEVNESEETVVKTVQQFHNDFIKFTEQLREVELLKQKYEKACTDNAAETKKLRRVFKLMLARLRLEYTLEVSQLVSFWKLTLGKSQKN